MSFAIFERPDGRAYWLRDRTGEAGNGIVIGAGAAVGGGSLVFNAIIVKPRRELFERVFPRQVNFDEMEGVYYPRIRRSSARSRSPQTTSQASTTARVESASSRRGRRAS
jgi:hypothetical protein